MLMDILTDFFQESHFGELIELISALYDVKIVPEWIYLPNVLVFSGKWVINIM